MQFIAIPNRIINLNPNPSLNLTLGSLNLTCGSCVYMAASGSGGLTTIHVVYARFYVAPSCKTFYTKLQAIKLRR